MAFVPLSNDFFRSVKLTKAAKIDVPPSQYELLGQSLQNSEDSVYRIIYLPVGLGKGFICQRGGNTAPGPWFSLSPDLTLVAVHACLLKGSNCGNSD
jgi:hypothetical protein